MRRLAVFSAALVMLLSLTACSFSLPLGGGKTQEDESSSSAEPSYVITTFAHMGLEKMMDGVNWYDNTVCAVQYLGPRDNYAKRLETLRQKYFSQIDAAAFQDIRVLDATGSDAFLLIPRFDLVNFSVFSIVRDDEENVHVLRQVGESAQAFVLLCDAGDNPNAQVNAVLTVDKTNQTFKTVIQRDTAGAVQISNGFQPLETK